MTEKAEAAAPDPARNTPEPADRLVVTQHTARVGGRELAYTATAGTIVLREESEKKKGEQEGVSEGEKARASVFFVAYTLRDAPEPGKRPVTFAFNGGPGSSSVWLHLGALGPRRVVMEDAGRSTRPPTGSPTTSTRCSPSPTSCSWTRSAPASAGRSRARRRRPSTTSRRTSSRSAISSACGARAIAAGRAPSS